MTVPRPSLRPCASSRADVWTFGTGVTVGDASMKSLLGGKGANLAEMSKIGLSVPPGFTITTETCKEYIELGNVLPDGVWDSVLRGLADVEAKMGLKLGDASSPLLLSVRSGAAISMPGMMDTVLNLGLNDTVVEGLAAKAGANFAYDSFRRFLDMYGNVVMGIPHELFEHELETLKQEMGVANDNELSSDDLKLLVEKYKAVYVSQGKEFPTDPLDQLKLSIFAVFDSWNSGRAIKFRAVQKIVGLAGTAVNVQAMAFGNMGDTSGTGVLFTRNAATGEKYLYGEYLINAQGEDVVAGIRTPEPIARLEETLPEAYAELVQNTEILEKHYKDMQDIEFTVQEGKLYMLQCRSGKRTGAAAVKIAVDMVDEGLVDPMKAVTMVEPTHLNQLLHPQFEDIKAHEDKVVASGLPASPGAAVGQIVFSTEDAEEAKAAGRSAILVRIETSPEDVGGMNAAQGILTQRGGMTSHAAVVARGWGKTCVSGASDIIVNESEKFLTMGSVTLHEGDWISLDGSTGKVYNGKVPVAPPTLSTDLSRLMAWVDEARELKVLTNADTPEDATTARENGAEGIGLVRTEHMFFKTDARIRSVRKMIMAVDTKARKVALDEILIFQREDFEGIFRAMDGLPVTIRLLDPPLHEFLPNGDDLEDIVVSMAKETGANEEDIFERIEKLSEINPMLGFRGCRLGITYPEICEMQARAILEAACNVAAAGIDVNPDIMVPLVGTKAELQNQKEIISQVATKVFAEKGCEVEYKVGTMIEIPRAALRAGDIATEADFFSFGTNDLTQMTFGYSRDDVAKFLPNYLEKGVLKVDPFEVLDQEGVGELIKFAVQRGRETRPDLKIGICGEHGGEPSSVAFCHGLLDYVSCSPFRVPIARLAAAQAAIAANK